MILIAVGTFVHGFDGLVAAADEAAGALGFRGVAQIGHGAYVPTHLEWRRFLPPQELQEALWSAEIVVTHAGMGLLGDAMRAQKPIVVVPRRGCTTRSHPANDQTDFARRLAPRLPLHLCEQPAELETVLRRVLSAPRAPVPYELGTDIPSIVRNFLAADEPSVDASRTFAHLG